jgi:EPS-associated MarR family transcriptional regulator
MDEELRLRLLRQLIECPDLSQRELAHRLGLSLGKTNYCLRALIDKGWVKVNNFRNSQNKLAYAYVLTPSGLRAKGSATADFLRRKQLEYARLESEIAQLRTEVQAQSAEEGSSRVTDAPLQRVNTGPSS